VIHDSIIGTLFYQYLIYWEGSYWVVLYALLIPVWILSTEYLQYLLLGRKDETFVIKFSPHLSDYTLAFVLAGTYIFVGYTLPLNIPINSGTFIFWVCMTVTLDFVFGITHYWTHKIPALRKIHLLHHEYRREDLNTIANYFSELSDSFLMNIPNVILSIFTVWFRQNPVVIKDIFTNAMHTHHKYPTHQLTHYYFFEFELIDMVTGRVRQANFHNSHHNVVDQYFSIVGIISDEVIVYCNNVLVKLLPRSNKIK
jgi:hypothetical protein